MGSQGCRGSMITKELPTFEQWMKYKMIPKEWGELKIEAIPILEKRVDADYYVPDNSASDIDVVFSIGLKKAATLDETEKIACMYASAMAAFTPELEYEFLCTMNHQNIHPRRICIPSQAKSKGIVLSEYEIYGPDEALVLFGTGLRILFKEINIIEDVNVYNRFVEKSVNALGSKLGMSDGVLSRLKFPLTLEKARALECVFGPYRDLKAKIIRYLMPASKENGNLGIFANYMCEILSWSGMTAFVSIKEVFHASNSPVMQNPNIQHEVRAFYEAMKKVDESEHPQFYRYFCGGVDEWYVEKSRFPILAEAAKRVILGEIRAKKSEDVAAKSNMSSP